MPARPGTRAACALAAAGAVLLGGFTGGPANATAPAYTVSVGKKGAWTHPDDSPAATYIDKDGRFHYLSAHAL